MGKLEDWSLLFLNLGNLELVSSTSPGPTTTAVAKRTPGLVSFDRRTVRPSETKNGTPRGPCSPALPLLLRLAKCNCLTDLEPVQLKRFELAPIPPFLLSCKGSMLEGSGPRCSDLFARGGRVGSEATAVGELKVKLAGSESSRVERSREPTRAAPAC